MSWAEQVNFQSDDDEVHFAQDQHAKLHSYSASSLKKQSADRYIASLGHIILIPVFSLSPLCCALREEVTHNNFTDNQSVTCFTIC